MSSKKAPTNEDLDAMFAGIGDGDSSTTTTTTNTTTPAHPTTATTSSTTTSSGTSTKKPTPTSTEADDDDDDPLAQLANLAAAPRVSSSISRPQTPRTVPPGVRGKPESVVNTPTSTVAGSNRTSEEKGRKSDEAVRSAGIQQVERQTQAEVVVPVPVPAQTNTGGGGGGGGWGSWGGWASNLATAAVKQAQAAVAEVQKNEEANKWAEQVKGNVGALRGLANLSELRDKALPTFTNILQTLAPPISQHERLQIHITHDLNGYPSMDPLIYQTFSRVMSQVEGGDLLVIQRGSESTQRRISEVAYSGGIGSGSGWSDGPWWRADDQHRSLNAVKGLSEGTKLTRVSACSYGKEFYDSRGGLEEAAKKATTQLSEANPVRTSDIFLAVQAINHNTPTDYFQAGSSAAEETEKADRDANEELVSFAVYLHDPVHSIDFGTLSQSFPQKWSEWLNASGGATSDLPAEIADIIENGGVDPREWIAEWTEEILNTAIGVLAQRYVARRMGVGEGAIGQARRREEAVDAHGGEAARAGII